LLGGMAETHTEWRLPEFAEELRVIANNQRRFIGFDDVEAGYEPKRGVVTIATMHAAKGLEWDRVYLMSVSNYGFPSALPYDSYIGERWYAAGNPYRGIEHLNLQAEAMAQLEALVSGREYYEGDATLTARADYVKERLRLLYVGITRARREVIVTWNMGRHWQRGRENQPAMALVALSSFLGVRNG
jgi:DNA helicase II / ATP-dependent DNA helicase PcrA